MTIPKLDVFEILIHVCLNMLICASLQALIDFHPPQIDNIPYMSHGAAESIYNSVSGNEWAFSVMSPSNSYLKGMLPKLQDLGAKKLFVLR